MFSLYFNDRKTLSRAIAAGKVVECINTGERFQTPGGCSMNYARKRATTILKYWTGCLFSVYDPTYALRK